MSRIARVLRLAAAAGLVVTGPLIGPVAAAHAGPSHVAIIIAGDKTACVAWHSGITGDDVLNAVARVTYRNDGLIITIDGKPASGQADDTHFWAYWHNDGRGWAFSGEGAGTFSPDPGTVEGWAFGNKAQPPTVSYASICHDSTPAPTPKPPSTHPPSTASAPVHGGSSSTPPPPPAASTHASTKSVPPSRRPRTPHPSTVATRPSTVDSTVSPTPTASPVSAARHHGSSALPAAGTAAGLVAAAAIGGVAFWRMRRQDGS